MAYINSFQLFGETSINLENDSAWALNSERLAGFLSGTSAKSRNVNTAIKSNSLVTMALMDLIASYGVSQAEVTLGLASSKSDIMNALVNVFQNCFAFSKAAGTETSGDILKLSLFNGSYTELTDLNVAHSHTADIADEATQASGANSIKAKPSNSNYDYNILMRAPGSQADANAQTWYGGNPAGSSGGKTATFNPSTGTFKSDQACVPTQYGNHGTCKVAAGTVIKTVSIPGFVLQTGAHVFVTFNNGNTTSIPLLDVSSTGAKPMTNGHTHINNIVAGKTYEFVYDGSYWILINSEEVDRAIHAEKFDGFASRWYSETFNQSSTKNYVDMFLLTNATYEFRISADYGNGQKKYSNVGIISFPDDPSDYLVYSNPYAHLGPSYSSNASGLERLVFDGSKCYIELMIISNSNIVWVRQPSPDYTIKIEYRLIQNNN